MLTSMLDKAIEIEGLIRIIRDGNPLPEAYVLLQTKTADLAQEAAKLDLQFETHQPEKPHVDFVMAPPPSISEMPEVVFANIVTTTPQTEELELEEEDDIILTFDDPHDDDYHEEATEPKVAAPSDTDKDSPVPTEQEQEPDAEDSEPEETMDDEPEPDKPESDEPKSDEQYTYDDSFDSEADENEHAAETDSHLDGEEDVDLGDVDLKVVVRPKRAIRLKSAFSLNDRFLYSRELFKGNMKSFDSTLEHIEEMEDFPAIERYFYKDLEWNREDSRVAAFMEVVRLWGC